MCRNVAEGVASYAEWAPPGWAPPPEVHEPTAVSAHVAAPAFVGWITAETTAHVAAYPATDEPRTFHLMHLFLTAALQGSGIAATLLNRVTADVRAQGASAMRLRTPTGNARGIAFYRREGWVITGDADPYWGLDMVWMRREQDAHARGAQARSR